MRMSASWFGSWTRRIQSRGAIDPRPQSGLPSDRHPDRTKRAVVLEAVKVWPGKGGVRRVGGGEVPYRSRRLIFGMKKGPIGTLFVFSIRRTRSDCLIVDFGIGVIGAGVEMLLAAEFEQLDAVVRADLVS